MLLIPEEDPHRSPDHETHDEIVAEDEGNMNQADMGSRLGCIIDIVITILASGQVEHKGSVGQSLERSLLRLIVGWYIVRGGEGS